MTADAAEERRAEHDIKTDARMVAKHGRRSRLLIGAIVFVAIVAVGWRALTSYRRHAIRRDVLRFAPKDTHAVFHVNLDAVRSGVQKKWSEMWPASQLDLSALKVGLLPPVFGTVTDPESAIRSVTLYVHTGDAGKTLQSFRLRGEFDQSTINGLIDPAAEDPTGQNGRYSILFNDRPAQLIFGSQARDLPEDMLWITIADDRETTASEGTAISKKAANPAISQLIAKIDPLAAMWGGFKSRRGKLRSLRGHIDLDERQSHIRAELASAEQSAAIMRRIEIFRQDRRLRDVLNLVRIDQEDRFIEITAKLGSISPEVLMDLGDRLERTGVWKIFRLPLDGQ